MTDIPTNIVYNGDNLDIMRDITKFPDGSVDLIYLDPPFFSGKDYDIVWEDGTEMKSYTAFTDKQFYKKICRKCTHEFHDDSKFCPECGASAKNAKKVQEKDINIYVGWLKARLKECHRILKPTGSIYVHLDHHAVHYVKVVMDEIFDKKNFQNEIIWCYRTGGASKQRFGRKHDNILFYTKTSTYKFNPQHVPYVMSGIKEDDKGLFQIQKGERVDFNSKGALMPDWWELSAISSVSKERLGYPTQKPIVLLERIIKAGSDKGDIVFDPFCGCATTLAAADKFGRRYIGIDISPKAAELIQKRIPTAKIVYTQLTMSDLRTMEEYHFQEWVCQKMLAKNTSPDPSRPSGPDKGVDGRVEHPLKTREYAGSPIQVKQSEKIGRDRIDAFAGTMAREGKTVGFFISLSFSDNAIKATKEIRKNSGINIVLINAADLCEIPHYDFTL
jgi:DNA modification methylase